MSHFLWSIVMHFYPSDQKQWNLSFTYLSFFFSHSSLSQKAKASSESSCSFISHVSFSLVNYHAFLSLWPAVKSLISFFFSQSSLYYYICLISARPKALNTVQKQSKLARYHQSSIARYHFSFEINQQCRLLLRGKCTWKTISWGKKTITSWRLVR